jgi:hypothetical protein
MERRSPGFVWRRRFRFLWTAGALACGSSCGTGTLACDPRPRLRVPSCPLWLSVFRSRAIPAMTRDLGDSPLPAPYVHPIPPKVTQGTQESAEGRNPKNTKRNGFPLRPPSESPKSCIPSHIFQIDGLNIPVIITKKIRKLEIVFVSEQSG